MEIPAQSNLIETLSRYIPSRWFFCSIRGFCIALLISYFLLIPVRFEYDIVATVIVSCLGSLIAILGLGVLILGLLNRKSLSISSGVPASFPVFSKQETTLCFSIQRLRLLPFFRIGYTIEFESSDIEPIFISLTSTGHSEETKVYVPITFPHRGNWRFKKITWTLSDAFDLWFFRKIQTIDDLQSVIQVVPALGFDSQPPIMSSCLRDGDAISDIQEPRGDYYDLKAYHPADGMRKIVWKIFARSGELLARHPEKTMTPEGKVLMFVGARSPHDGAARLAVNYCRQVFDAGLECSAVTLGDKQHGTAHSPDDLEKLLVETAWSSNTNGDEDIEDLLDVLTGQSDSSTGSIITQILIVGDFVSADEGYTELLTAIGSKVSERGLSPIYLLAMPQPFLQGATLKPGVFSPLKNLLIEKDTSIPSTPKPEEFLFTAASRKWETFRIFE